MRIYQVLEYFYIWLWHALASAILSLRISQNNEWFCHEALDSSIFWLLIETQFLQSIFSNSLFSFLDFFECLRTTRPFYFLLVRKSKRKKKFFFALPSSEWILPQNMSWYSTANPKEYNSHILRLGIDILNKIYLSF